MINLGYMALRLSRGSAGHHRFWNPTGSCGCREPCHVMYLQILVYEAHPLDPVAVHGWPRRTATVNPLGGSSCGSEPMIRFSAPTTTAERDRSGGLHNAGSNALIERTFQGARHAPGRLPRPRCSAQRPWHGSWHHRLARSVGDESLTDQEKVFCCVRYAVVRYRGQAAGVELAEAVGQDPVAVANPSGLRHVALPAPNPPGWLAARPLVWLGAFCAACAAPG